MRYIYRYIFAGIEATFTIEAVDRQQADERFEAMKTAQFDGTLIEETPISDEEMMRYTVIH